MNRIYRGGMTTASGGNISIRDGVGNIWTTPGGTDKGLLSEDDIVCITPGGSIENQKGNAPTSELPTHLAIYREREDIHAIIHAHPPALVTYSAARQVPESRTTPETYEWCGEAGYAAYEISGSEELGQRIAGQFGKGRNCVIMENHAAVVGGENLLQAFHRFESLENCAEALIKAKRLGRCRLLTDEQLTGFSDQWNDPLPERDADEANPYEGGERDTLCTFVRRACSQRLMSGAAGGVSIRCNEHSFVITPDSADRYRIKPEEIVRIGKGKREVGKYPDRLAQLHIRIFENHPHVQCIAVAQPPNILAYCLAGAAFNTSTIPESYVFLREIPRLPFGSLLDGGQQIVSRISEKTPLLMIENGGVLVTGRSVPETFHRLEIAEFSAKSLIDTELLGGEVPLEKERLEELTRKFVR